MGFEIGVMESWLIFVVLVMVVEEIKKSCFIILLVYIDGVEVVKVFVELVWVEYFDVCYYCVVWVVGVLDDF